MKKNLILFTILLFIVKPAFSEILLIQNMEPNLLSAENYYEFNGKTRWMSPFNNSYHFVFGDLPMSFGMTANIKINSSELTKFYLGGGFQFDTTNAVMAACFTPAVSFLLSENTFPMELTVFSKAGAGTCILWPDFYMFAELNPCFMCFFGQGSTFFAGAGPVIRYTQTYNYEIYNRIDFSININFGYRWK